MNKGLMDKFLSGDIAVGTNSYSTFCSLMDFLEENTDLIWATGGKPTELRNIAYDSSSTCVNVGDCGKLRKSPFTYFLSNQIKVVSYEELVGDYIEKETKGDFEKILIEMLTTYREKNDMYGDSFGKSVDKYGIIAALTRISDKFNRFEQMILNDNNGTSDESLRDTLLDMASYCVMTIVELKNV